MWNWGEGGYFDRDHGPIRHNAIGITSDDSGDVSSYNQYASNDNANDACTK